MSPSDTADLEPIYISVKQAAAMLGIVPWSVYELLKDDKLDARYFGKRRLIRLDSVRAFAETLPAERPEETA